MAYAKDLKEEYECDKCKAIFKGNKAVLKKVSKNIEMHSMGFTSHFVFVDKRGKIVGGNEAPDPSKGDKVIHCPKCDYPHLFGMNRRTQ